MCKYCDGSGTPLASDETDHRDAEIRIDCNALIADLRHDYLTAEISFCPMCRTPLGEVKPLTVEQLAERVGKPVWCEWLHEEDRAIERGKWFIIVSEKDGFSVKCPLDFGSHVCKLGNYGTGWLAFDREPKGDAEWVK